MKRRLMTLKITPQTSQRAKRLGAAGFTAVELVSATVIFPIIVIGLASSFNAMKRSYTTARQLNEVYAVLSACPEVDRALEYTSLSSSTNCYPNNTFQIEDSPTTATTAYSPTLTVSDTSSLSGTDPLQPVPDSKVVDIQVGLPKNTTVPKFKLRLLITRNGIGQL
jgi:hypothetical protein